MCVHPLHYLCRIQVSCAGVNRLDLLQAAGKYPPPPGESDILGVEGTKHAVTVLEPSCHTAWRMCTSLPPPPSFHPPFTILPSLPSPSLPSPSPSILNHPVSGTVADMSAEAAEKSGLKLGDPVFALVGGGGYAGARNFIKASQWQHSPHLHPLTPSPAPLTPSPAPPHLHPSPPNFTPSPAPLTPSPAPPHPLTCTPYTLL